MSLDPRVVKESFATLEASGDEVVKYFYGRLFVENPELRSLFPPMMDAQRDRMFRALTRIVWSLDSPAALTAYLARLGREHRKYGVIGEHYRDVGRALLATLRVFCGQTWTEEAEAAWSAAFTAVAETMSQAADEDAKTSPPWWVGEVVGHELRTHDIAVLTVRPHQALPHQAGQYLAVQTARWPRVWRPYSIANAPRADGLLNLHVRAQPGGWVSGALVRHTKRGDTLLLGPATGAMTLTPDPERDVLLIAGGTGLAPLKALVEQAVESGRGQICLLYGARTARDLYDLPDLRRLAASCPRLRVIPVLSGERGDRIHGDSPGGEDSVRGDVCEVLDQLGDWSDHEVYVSGPEAMVGKTVARLHQLGVPAARTNHDPLGGGRPPAFTRRPALSVTGSATAVPGPPVATVRPASPPATEPGTRVPELIPTDSAESAEPAEKVHAGSVVAVSAPGGEPVE